MKNEIRYNNRIFKQVGFFADLLIYAYGDSRILLDKNRNIVCKYTILNSPRFSNGGEMNESTAYLKDRGYGK